ncbi:MAG TPA: class I SAM-dependent methyltransferase [Burkholderiales bacterium]|nr:class I SAM-dependent methyltransferase [Burkholderiales bacterium]
MPTLSKRNGQDERAALFPPELLVHFDDAMIASFDLYEEYISRLALVLFRATGLEAACRSAASVTEAVTRAGLVPEAAHLPASWILALLASRDWIARETGADGKIRYRLGQALPLLDPEELRAAQQAHDPRCLPAYDIAALAAAHYPDVLSGRINGEQALFGEAGIIPWVKYFSNDNPMYAISNKVGAIAAAQATATDTEAILEIGGGLGSGAIGLFDHFESIGRMAQIGSYTLTEISPLFLKRAQRNLAARNPGCAMRFVALDINHPFAGAGIAPGSFSMVYGVNVLHVARDLGKTLAELRGSLRDRGLLVMAECIRPFAHAPLHLELVFNLLGSFRDAVLVPDWRPNGGFLTPEQWTAALEANGFQDMRVYPDIAAIRDDYPSFVVGAILARRS